MTAIPLYLSLSLNRKHASVWVCIFSKPLLGNAYYRFPVLGTAATRQKITVTVTAAKPTVSMPLYCFVYAELKQGASRYMTRIGFATVSLDDAEQGRSQRIYDVAGVSVGLLKLEIRAGQAGEAAEVDPSFTIDDDSKSPVRRLGVGSKPLLELQQQAEKQLQMDPWEERSNVPSTLDHFVFEYVTQHCGITPMWAFTSLNMETKAVPGDAYLEQCLYNAKYLLMVPKVDFKDKKQVAELLNEIQTLPVRAQLYVIDQSEDRFVDDWLNPLLCPSQALAGLDCEDAVQRMLQEGYWLTTASAKASDELVRLARIEKENYISFLAAMTLKMPDGTWVYHAAGLKLDRTFVLQKLGLTPKLKQEQKGEWWPAVLLEGTAYTTGCWSYESPMGTQTADRIAQNSDVQFRGGTGTICKATPALMAQKDLYGPIQSLFSRTLLEDFGVVQIELGEFGARAATPKSVMGYSDKVQWVKIMLDRTKVRKQLEQLKTEAFPCVPVPVVAKKANRPVIKPRDKATIDCCVRAADWNDNLLREFTESSGTTLRVTTLDLAADLKLVHVTDS